MRSHMRNASCPAAGQNRGCTARLGTTPARDERSGGTEGGRGTGEASPSERSAALPVLERGAAFCGFVRLQPRARDWLGIARGQGQGVMANPNASGDLGICPFDLPRCSCHLYGVLYDC